jgi:hypothetical protein
MSFTTDIQLTGDAASDQTYSQISLVAGKCIRSDSARTLGNPRTLIISHEQVGKQLKAMDRHLIRLNIVEEDTGTEEIATISGSVYCVIEAPRRIVTEAMLSDMVTQMVDFLTTAGNLTKILNNEP